MQRGNVNLAHTPAPHGPPLYTCLLGGRKQVMVSVGGGDRVLTTGLWSGLSEPWCDPRRPLRCSSQLLRAGSGLSVNAALNEAHYPVAQTGVPLELPLGPGRGVHYGSSARS